MVAQMEASERLTDELTESGWYSKRTKLEKILIIFSFLTFVAFLISIIVFPLVYSKKESSAHTKIETSTTATTEPSTHKYKVCETEDCIKTANMLLSNMDKFINPCDDFYAFACGRYIHKHDEQPAANALAEFQSTINNRVVEIMESKNRMNYSKTMNASVTFYNKCIDTDRLNQQGMQPLLDVLMAIFNTSWPLGNPNWKIQSVLDKNMRFIRPAIISNAFKYGFNLLFKIQVLPDTLNTSTNILVVDTLSGDDFRFETQKLFKPPTAKMRYNLADYQFELAKKLATLLQLNFEIDTLKEDAKNMFSLYRAINKNNLVNTSKTDSWKSTTIEQFEKDINSNGWMLQIFKELMPPGVKLSPLSRIWNPKLSYFKELFALINSTDIRSLTNYLFLTVVMNGAFFVSDELRSVLDESDVKNPTARKISCAEKVTEFYAFAVVGQYGKIYFPLKDKERPRAMLENVIASFKENVKENTWMDPITKQKTIEKASVTKRFIGYPNWTLSNEAVDKFYNKFLSRINPTETLLADLHNNKLALCNHKFGLVGKPTNRKKWDRISVHMTPMIANAFYDPLSNSIKILLGVIGGAAYSPERLLSLNYGGLGTVLGHELVHGFDNSGRRFDKYGNLRNWWDNATLNAFLNRTVCFVDQYSALYDNLTGLHIHGKQTLGENIADNGGVKASFKAYQKWISKNGEESILVGMENFTPNQLFFLGFANAFCSKIGKEQMREAIISDEHCPNKYRINGANSNFKEFADAFKCPKGSRMNPKHRCAIW